MIEARYEAASIVTKEKLWVTGGIYFSSLDEYGWELGKKILSTTEYIGLDGKVEPGEPLPSAKHGHCMAPVLKAKNAKTEIDQTFIIGGYHTFYKDITSSTWIFDHSSKTYKENLPNMKEFRYSLGCATFYSKGHNRRPILIAAGDSDNHFAEILDYTNNDYAEWMPIIREHGKQHPYSGFSSFDHMLTYPSKGPPSNDDGAIFINEKITYIWELKCKKKKGCKWIKGSIQVKSKHGEKPYFSKIGSCMPVPMFVNSSFFNAQDQ